MKNPFNFFKSLFFWNLLGVIGLLLLIWFIGPEIAIGSIKPLLSEKIRIIVCMGIVAVWFGKIIYRHWREVRRYALISKEIKASQESILQRSDDETVMASRFAEIDKILKNSKLAKTKYNWLDVEQYKYQLPWYIVLGASGSGKTTALKQSGLNFPLESTLGSSITGLTTTQDFDWFLTDEALLLDTSGRLSVHGKRHGHKNSKDWEEFITLLKQYRPKQPVNGLVVTVGVDDLLGDSTNLLDLAAELKRRIQEMRTQFGINFPIYLTITKLDLLHGFNSFFSHLTEVERSEHFGIPFHNESMIINHSGYIKTATDILTQIENKFRSFASTIANNLDTPTERAAAFVFPDEFGRLSKEILKFLQELSKSSKFEEPVQWRGIYFSSAIQNESTCPFIIEKKLYHDFQLVHQYSETGHFQPVEKKFFLNKLFSDIIFCESSLASENRAWFIKRRTIYWSGVVAITGIATTALILMLISYFHNSTYLNRVKEQAINLSNEIQKVKKSNFTAIDIANRVKGIVGSQDIPDLSKPPIDYRMGLYQGDQMQDVVELAYKRLLHDGIMPLISYKLDDLLRNVALDRDDDFTYNALKAYLMMFNKEYLDKDFMHSWLIQNLFNDGQLNDRQQETVSQALKDVLSSEMLTFNVPYDQELVDSRRKRLSSSKNMNITAIVLNQVLEEVARNKDKLTPVSFSSMGGGQSDTLFERKSGKSLNEPIDSAYTVEAYVKFITPNLKEKTSNLFKERLWVLENYAAYPSDNEDIALSRIQQKYFEEYVKAWEDYILDLQLKSPKSINESVEFLKLLSLDKDKTPLVGIINGISENTILSSSNQWNTDSETHPKLLKFILLSKETLNKYKDLLDVSDKDGEIKSEVVQLFNKSTPVDDEFEHFHILVQSQKDQPSTINTVVSKINALYEFAINVRDMNKKGVSDLTLDMSPVTAYKAAVERLPDPFKKMLKNLSDFIQDEKATQEEKKKAIEEEEENKKKQRQDEESMKSLMSSLTKELASIAQQCDTTVDQGYPFQSRSSTNDVSIESFTHIFGSNGIYQQFRQLTGETASWAKVDSLDALMAKDEKFRDRFAALDIVSTIRQTYFNKGTERPQFDFTLEIALLDPAFDSLHLTYDGKKQVYSHGPVVPMNLSWPSNSEKPQIKLEFFSSKAGTSSINTTGIWSVFRLIEKGKIKEQNNNTTIVEYTIQGKPVILKFTTLTSNNPFNLNHLRGFQCIG